MSFFEGAQHTTILGGTQIAAASGSVVNYHQASEQEYSRARGELSAAVAHTALHDSAARSDAPRCHRNTRANYLNKLELWMLGKGEEFERRHLIWLNGGAGAGKSAIMQSIVERCAQHDVVLGSFFFFRADASRNYAEVLIPTLAYQLARAFPEAMVILEPVINRDPLIFKASLRTQAYELLVRPLLYLIEAGIFERKSTLRRVFVIDGLDECNNPQKQALIVHAITSILCDYHLPICFLISSRPEVAISYAFQKEKSLVETFATIILDDNDDAESDIRQFIEDSFLDILDSHPLRHHITLPWPDLHSIDSIVWNSSGHFIYAATAMKFIASSDEHPVRALEVVKGLKPSRTDSPFAQLDSLYLHILTSAKYSKQVLGILRHCYLTRFRNSVAAVCRIYDISPEDVELFLSDVQSLVFLSPDEEAEMFVTPKHASLRDFLTDENRSPGLYIDKPGYNALFLARYFQLLDNSPQLPISSLYARGGEAYYLVDELARAIRYSQENDLLQSMIRGHTPKDIRDFCVASFALDTTTSSRHVKDKISSSVCLYMCAIRDSIANSHNILYTHQFKMYIQLILDDISKFAHRRPQYRIIPALIFTSNPSGLVLAYHLMRYFARQFRISGSYRHLFHYLQGTTVGVVDPRSFEAIRHLPQYQLSWGSDLAIALKLILQKLMHLSWIPEWLCYRQRGGWLLRNKSLRQRSLGPRKLSPNVNSYLRKLQDPHFTNLDVWRVLTSHGLKRNHIFKILRSRNRSLILLKAVIFYLPKSDCTGEVVTLARRLLPKGALWFPKLMKMARAKMDAYVIRWEESLDSIWEKAKSVSINQMD